MSGTYDLRRFFDGEVGRRLLRGRRRCTSCPSSTASTLEVLRHALRRAGQRAREPTRTSASRGRWRSVLGGQRRPEPRRPVGHRSGRTTGRPGGPCSRATWASRELRRAPVRQRRRADAWASRRRVVSRSGGSPSAGCCRTCGRWNSCSPTRRSRPACTASGAEQEMFLVDASWQPAPGALEVLAAIDRHALHDRGRRLQPRAQPRPAGVHRRLPQPRRGASSTSSWRWPGPAPTPSGLEVVLAGILPTIRKGDLRMENMVQNPRYLALNQALMDLRGEDYELHIKGTDELRVRAGLGDGRGVQRQLPGPPPGRHRTSSPTCTTSPSSSPDPCWPAPRTRRCCSASGCGPRRASRSSSSRSTPGGPATTCASAAPASRSGPAGCSESVAELYREDITRHRPVLAPDDYDDPFEAHRRGSGAEPDGAAAAHRHGVALEPRVLRRLRAACRTSASRTGCCRPGRAWSTRWPTPRCGSGLMRAVGTRHHDVSRLMEFEQARANLVAAARQGLAAHLTWLDGEERPATALALDHLLPLAADGPRRGGHRRRRPRPLPRRRRAAGPVRPHGLALAAHVADGAAGPGHRGAAAEQRDRGDGRPAEGPGRRSPSGPRPASTRAAAGATTS